MPEKIKKPQKEQQVEQGLGGAGRKEMNEAFFAKKGDENRSRREDLPPSQGGKYGGFGSEPTPPPPGKSGGENEAMPGVDDFQKDPVAALTKGFGWFTTTVGKGAKSGYDGWIQPNVQKVGPLPPLPQQFHLFQRDETVIGELTTGRNPYTNVVQLAAADLPTQARLTAAQVAQNIQTGSKNAAESFNRFVEDSGSGTNSTTRKTAAVEPEHRDFWDTFGSPVDDDEKPVKSNLSSMGAVRSSSPATTQGKGRGSPAPGMGKGNGSAIGTAAMRKGGKEREEDRWDDF
ncbi:MAG: hypothetical protein Q9222_004272 [Ikaeria aurantiellina]